MRLLAAMLPGPKEATLPSPTGPDCRVLFTRYERIGDMIMATSLIRNIATVAAERKSGRAGDAEQRRPFSKGIPTSGTC